MNRRERSLAIFEQHLAMATVDYTAFRKTVINQIIAEFTAAEGKPCSIATASTQFNNCKQNHPATKELGRQQSEKPRVQSTNPVDEDVDEDDCYSVIELIKRDSGYSVGRTRSFVLQGDASETFDAKVESYPNSSWVMIRGIGPIYGETYRLRGRETEIKRYDTEAAPRAQATYVFMVDTRQVKIKAESRSEAIVMFEERYPEEDSTICDVLS